MSTQIPSPTPEDKRQARDARTVALVIVVSVLIFRPSGFFGKVRVKWV